MLTRRDAGVPRLSRLLAGFMALPLSSLPFLAYTSMTPEGRLVRDQAVVAVAPPKLPKLSARDRSIAAAVAPRYEGGVMALAYHGIGSGSDAEGGFVVSPRRFGEHLATLNAAGMNTVTAADVERSFRGGAPLPDNAVMITFDDGRTDAMLFADPLLEQAGMSATMFVITDAASKPGVYYAPWKKLKGYARSGRWDLQSHTSGSHHEQKVASGEMLPALTSLGRNESLDAYRERIRADLAGAADALEERIGSRPVALAYPFGAYGAERTNDPAIRDILREEVSKLYALAFHQDDQEQVPLVTAKDDRLGLRRLEVESWSGAMLLQQIADAAHRSGLAQVNPPAAGDGPIDVGDIDELALPAPPPPTPPGEAVPPPAAGAVPTEPAGSSAPGAAPAPQESGSVGTASAGSSAVAAPVPTSPTPTRPPGTSTPTAPVTSPPATSPPATSPPATSPPATTTPTTTRPPTTPPTTAPPTTIRCPDKGKQVPGCPPRGGK